MPHVSLTKQVYPKLYLNGGSMYDAKWWRWLVRGWELTVWNPVLDLDRWGPVLLPGGVVAWVGWKAWRRFGGGWQQVGTTLLCQLRPKLQLVPAPLPSKVSPPHWVI